MHGDVREFPRYSIFEAAFYVRVPPSTLRAWCRGQDYTTRDGRHRTFQPLIEMADPENRLLSFFNLVEAHVLRSITEIGDIPLKNVRKALDYVRESIPGPHPLVVHDFEVSGKDVFVRHLGNTINATRGGQLAMRKILEKHLKRVSRDAQGLPVKIFPINSKRLEINPLFSSGKPIVKGRGITAAVVWGRRASGETVSEIAKDYGLPTIEVEQTIKEYEWNRAA